MLKVAKLPDPERIFLRRDAPLKTYDFHTERPSPPTRNFFAGPQIHLIFPFLAKTCMGRMSSTFFAELPNRMQWNPIAKNG